MPTLRQFEYFLAVVDEGSFTRAAEQLYVTQPGLSQQVAALERELGGSLFARLPRTVNLTPTGRALLPHARAAVDAAHRASAAARAVSGSEGGELRIATVYSASLGLLPPVLQAWRAENPEVSVRLYEHRHGDALSAAMLAGQADVAVGPVPVTWRGRLRRLGVEELVLVLPPAPGTDAGGAPDPYAPRAGVLPLARLSESRWVQYAPEHALADVLVDACAAAGFRPAVAVRTEQTAVAPLLAAAGIGPALVPAAVVPVGFVGRVARPEPPVQREVAAYTGPEPDRVTSRFVALLARVVDLVPEHVQALIERS